MRRATHELIGTADPAASGLYELDEHAWIAAQICALTERHLNRLDRDHLVQYLTGMTIPDSRELRSRLTVLLHNLLKLRLQPDRLTRIGVMTIIEQQREVRSIIESIPSPGRQTEAIATEAYPDAVRRAARETAIARQRFPAVSPWTLHEALVIEPPEPAPRGQRLA